MNIVLKSVVVSLCLLAPLRGHAQDDDRAARLVAAKAYVDLSLSDFDMPKVIEQIWRPIVPQIEQSTGKTLNQDQLAKIDALYRDVFSTKLQDIMAAQDEVIADTMTLPEIETLRDFYASEIGHAVMLKLPMVLAKQQPQILEMVQSTMPTMMPKLKEIVMGQ